MTMEPISYFILQIFLPFLLSKSCVSLDVLLPNETITDGKTLVSSGQSFELGFFSPGNLSTRYYLGIWYKKHPEIIVWVANRQNPVKNSSGVLSISSSGELAIWDNTGVVVWSSGSSKTGYGRVAKLLESGNFVLKRENDDSEEYIWQSFDFPTDTLLPGMKMGWDLNTGLERHLTSWKNEMDPSLGDFTYRIDYLGMPEFVLRKGLEKKFRTGPWNGIRFSGLGVLSTTIFKPIFLYDDKSLYYMYEFVGNSIATRLVISHSGTLQRLVNQKGSSWSVMYSVPNDQCDEYGRCGPSGICKVSERPICECLDGFVPKSKVEWDVFNWSGGCVRRTPLDCWKEAEFLKVSGVKLPDLLEFSLDKNMSLDECKTECKKNCSCTAYASSDIRGRGSGCFMWFGDLVDTRQFSDESSEQDIYIRMLASELNRVRRKRSSVLIIIVSSISGVLIFGFFIYCLIQKRKSIRGSYTSSENIELPVFDLVTVTNATDNFSWRNMIGEGGYGSVYKGTLSTGQEIAVKRLSKHSGQGLQEFKNEVVLISKLQHRNLVKLLGCCVEGDEKMLIYEYMPNKSLDYFIFDQEKKVLLRWQKRFQIAMGISRGLLYLHQDSRLRIIHRDLKTSNILLDRDLNPRISDFGIARIFGADQNEGKTKRVVGTYGYMSPEYAFDGKFSVKSDVFSLGVLLLEIVSGKRNRTFSHPEHHHNLLGHAWLLWKQGRALELMDEVLLRSYDESEVMRCIQVGLLCVQKLPADRPTMASVVCMWGNEGVIFPQPKEPGYFMERCSSETDTSTSQERCVTGNELTITMMEAR